MKKCDRCDEIISVGDEITHHSQTLCEICYMEALSPTRACDPWAVRSAVSLAQRVTGKLEISEIQAKILELLEGSDGADLDTIQERTGLPAPTIMRELAALRHMEKLKATMRDGAKLYVLW